MGLYKGFPCFSPHLPLQLQPVIPRKDVVVGMSSVCVPNVFLFVCCGPLIPSSAPMPCSPLTLPLGPVQEIKLQDTDQSFLSEEYRDVIANSEKFVHMLAYLQFCISTGVLC